jgi:hypothetical protein
MKSTTMLVALASVVVLAGCSARETKQPESRTTEQPGRVQVTPPETAAPQPATNVAAVSLAGTVGCGHCTYGVVGECAAAVKTSDGIVHVLEGVDPTSQLFTERKSGAEIQVTGIPREADGLHWLTVESYQF